MFVPPTDGETQPKYVGSKPFWWCTKHKKWCRHKTAKCEGKGIGKGQNKSSDSSQTKSPKKKKKQEIMRALGAAAQDDDEEEVTDSEDEE
jgi:hypothetical protein